MRNHFLLCIFTGLLGILQSVRIEISKENIVQRLQKDYGFFQERINEKLRQQNRQDNSISLDYQTLQIEDPQESKQKAVKFTIEGSASQEKFTAVVVQKLEPSQPWAGYKYHLQSDVKIFGIENDILRRDVTAIVSRLAIMFTDWTNNNMWGSSEQMYGSHLAIYLFVRNSDYFYTNGQSIFYVHCSNLLRRGQNQTNLTDINFYQDAPQLSPSRYFGITLNDQCLKKMFTTFLSREKNFDFLHQLRYHNLLFPEINSMNVFWLSSIFPKLETLYDKNQKVNIILNPIDAFQNWVDNAIANFKAEFNQDHIELSIPLIFDINVKNSQNGWDEFRRCYLEGQPFKFQINGLPAGVQKIMIVNPKSPSERTSSFFINTFDLDIEEEQIIVKGLVNNLVEKFFRQLTTLPLELPTKFSRFDIEEVSRNFKLSAIPGYLDFGIESLDLNQIPSLGFNFVDKAGHISGSFQWEEGERQNIAQVIQLINEGKKQEYEQTLSLFKETKTTIKQLEKKFQSDKKRLFEEQFLIERENDLKANCNSKVEESFNSILGEF
ncbi:UNKNOWN [Stylonychia lemnae]|uniref:Uncharacterized protein n=1 Tax=Stylonychia lemnae TaxID=5949 RepID=A0A078AHB2_STYLE|nr:UNKNOWN [Stylonychia lemnae]|eukprot:CDW81231.1 UNKNOWN [Stylonychia lemnae]